MRAVLERDFLSQIARPRSFVLRAAVGALVAFVLVMVMIEDRRGMSARPDEVAQVLFAGGGITVLVLLAVLAPPAVVGAILDERRRETLPLVLSTPVGPFAFAAAKLLSRSLAALAWALAAFFPLASVLLLGGVSGQQVADLALLAVGVVLEIAAWGVFVSSVTRRPATGVVLAYLLPFSRWAGSMLLGALLLFPPGYSPGPPPGPARVVAGGLLTLSTPIPGAVRMVDPGEYGRGVAGVSTLGVVPTVAGEPSFVFLACSLGLAGLSILAAGRRLSREAEPRAGAPAWFRRRAVRPPPDGGNPVMWKETRLLNTAASRPLYYGAFALMVAAEAAFVVACCTELRHAREVTEVGLAVASGYASFLGIVAAVVAAASIAHERSSGTLDLLRASLLRPEEILRGKLHGVFRGSAFLLAIPLLHLAALWLMDAAGLATIAAAILYTTMFVIFWACAGVACGITAARSGAAIGRAAAVLGVVFVGVPFAAISFAISTRGEDFAEFVFFAWPPVTTYGGLESLEILLHPAFRSDYWQWNRTLRDHNYASLLWTAGYAVAAVALLIRAPGLLARRLDRDASA